MLTILKNEKEKTQSHILNNPQFNPLLAVLNPRTMERPMKAFKELKGIDKLYAKNMVQLEAYSRLRNEFLDRKEYTHFILCSDDAEVKQKNIDKLIHDVGATNAEVMSGICNVDMEEQINDLAACLKGVDPVWKDRNYDFIKKEQLKGIHKVEWSGFPLTCISRRVIQEIPFRNDAESNGNTFGQSYDVMLSHDLAKKEIPQYVNFDNFFWHLKGQEGFKTYGVGKRELQLILERQGEPTEIIYRRPADNFKLIATVVVYNEESNIEDQIYSLQRIEDLDALYILDGRYMDDDYKGDFKSTDKTKEIVSKSRIGLFNKYWVSAQKWKSQSHKRNWLWDFIEKREDSDCWFLIIDGDEEIVLPKGMRSMKLKPVLKRVKEDFVILESGPHGDNLSYPLEYFQPRLFRSNRGIHWNTGEVMVLHDKNCKVMMDHGRGILAQPYSWIKNLMILNKWMLRPKDKIRDIVKYRKERKLVGDCEYRKN